MKRVAIFLILAVGGISALIAWGGGLTGSNAHEPSPVVAEIPASPHAAGGVDPVTIEDLPGIHSKGGSSSQGAPIQIDPFDSYNRTVAERVVFTDPDTGERIEIPNAPKADFRFKKAALMRDAAGSPGVRWQSVHIVLYREAREYTRAIAEALRANPATGRKGLELYDITADEGYETTTTLPPAPGEKESRGRTVIHITKNVLIHDYARKLDVRTSDAVVDYDAQTAQGVAPVEVESKSYLVRGQGFRIDCKTQRLEILENTEFDAIDLAGDVSKLTADGESNGMRPRRIQAKGSTLIVRRTDAKDLFTDVRMEGGVHVEMEGGQQLDADSVSLRLVKRAGDAPAKGPGDENRPAMRLDRMTADGNVRYDGKDENGALLTAQGPKLAVDFRGRLIQSMRLAGRSIVTWRGEMALPGEQPSDRIVSAKATESILFAPDAESPDASLLDLVGAARVECGRAPTDATPQRIAADRITLHLHRSLRSPDVSPRATTPSETRRKSTFEWIPTSFTATGGVILDGPRLSGAARDMKGFDLDKPIYRVTASGPDAHLEVADDPEPKKTAATRRSDERAGPSPTADASAPRRTWTLLRLAARENAAGALRVRAGEGGARFSGESMLYSRATGAEIRALPGKDAHLTLEGRADQDRTIDANTIYLRNGAQERILETVGRTHTVFSIGDDAPAAAAPSPSGPGRRVVELRSGSRIDIAGSQGTKTADATLSVTLIDGGAMSVRTDGVVTDRLTATTIEMSLIETVPAPGEMGFALPGRRTDEATPAKPAAAPTAAAKPTARKASGRLVIDSDALSLAIGTESQAGSSGGLRRVKAEGNVKAVKETGTDDDDPKNRRTEFEGARFEYDAKTDTGVLLGTAKKNAVVTLGREPAIDRFLSPRIDLSFKDGQMSRAVFAAPVRGMFHKKPSSEAGPVAGRNLYRFLLESYGGPLTVEGETATVAGTATQPVVVEFTKRDPAGVAVGDPMKISTPHLALSMSKQLGGPGSTLVATGPGTRMETGADAAKRDSAEGDTIRFEMPANAKSGVPGAEGLLRITSATGTVRVKRGGNAYEGFDVLYDLATGQLSAKIRRADLGGSK